MTYRFKITESQYLEAVTEACLIVDSLYSGPRLPLSSADACLKCFVACIYDSIVPAEIMNALSVSDPSRGDVPASVEMVK